MRFISVCAAALLLAGCANSSIGGLSADKPARPKAIVVTDFVFANDVVAVDRSFTARLERKIGTFPTFERKQRTNERVNDEIVATIVATLREAGLEAQPGSEDSLSLKDDAVLISGSLRAADPEAGRKNQVGFGSGRAGVIADMAVSAFSSFGKKQLLGFSADAPGGRKTGNAKTAAAANAALGEALGAAKAAPEKLSPDVEAQARGLGRAVGDKVVAFAREQGWVTAESAEPAPEAKPAKPPARKPENKPEKKTGKKPAKPDTADKPED
jgi:hypothetical protein